MSLPIRPLSKEERALIDEKYGGYADARGIGEDRRRIARGEPLAYVIGHQPFLGLTIYMDSHPLIPRPETEWWTNELLSSLAPSPLSEGGARSAVVRRGPSFRSVVADRAPAEPFTFLDLCAGSGAIGCAALARLPSAQVYFGELDPAYESTILKNIRENNLDESRADVRIGDLFEPFGDMRFDVIAANPPYIPSDRALETSVIDYEPHAALFSGTDGLELIRRIAEELPCRLNPGGMAWIECDSAHAEEARRLFEAAGLPAEISPDQYGEPRFLVVPFEHRA